MSLSTTPPTPRRALIVIDVQNEYFEGGGLPIAHPPIGQTLPRVTQAMDAASAASVPVIVVHHAAPPGSPLFVPGTPGGALHPEIARRPRDLGIEKDLPSAFAGTRLAHWLQRHRIDTLAVAGYMTHNCVASTVFDAMHRGLQVEVLSDATGALPYRNAAGAATAEEIHRVFQVVFESNFAAVVDTSTWIAAVRDGTALPRDNVLASHRRALGAANAR